MEITQLEDEEGTIKLLDDSRSKESTETVVHRALHGERGTSMDTVLTGGEGLRRRRRSEVFADALEGNGIASVVQCSFEEQFVQLPEISLEWFAEQRDEMHVQWTTDRMLTSSIARRDDPMESGVEISAREMQRTRIDLVLLTRIVDLRVATAQGGQKRLLAKTLQICTAET